MKAWRTLMFGAAGLVVVAVVGYLATFGFDNQLARFVQALFRAVGWLVASDEVKRVAPGEHMGDYFGRAIWLVIVPFLILWCLWGAWLNKRDKERERERWYGKREPRP
jgi:hypothetical protein